MLRPEFLFLLFGYFITVACFLLWVRHLRGKYSRDFIDGLAKKVAEFHTEHNHKPDNSPIANSEQPSTVFPVSKQETQNKQEPCQPVVKIPKGWKKADGKTRHVKTGLVDIMWGDGAIDLNQLARVYQDAWIKSDSKVLDIIAYRVCKPKKPVKNQKVFISKASATKTRKTVTVKKRATK
jgi:hypothetical protein